MSLDNFGVKSTRKKIAPKKKSSPLPKKKSKKKKTTKKEPETTPSGERKKYYLKCTAKCGYKRTLKKRTLTDDDFICRKCGKIHTRRGRCDRNNAF